MSNCKGLMDYEGVYVSSEVTYKFEVSIMFRSSDGIARCLGEDMMGSLLNASIICDRG